MSAIRMSAITCPDCEKGINGNWRKRSECQKRAEDLARINLNVPITSGPS